MGCVHVLANMLGENMGGCVHVCVCSCLCVLRDSRVSLFVVLINTFDSAVS